MRPFDRSDWDSETTLDRSSAQRIIIPVLQVQADIIAIPRSKYGWDLSDLRLQVAWLGGTALPGEGSNTVLAGHIATRQAGVHEPFRYLHQLRAGDSIIIETEQETYYYEVRTQFEVDPNQVEVLAPTENSQLTLITCTKWNEEKQDYTRRRVLIAELVWLGSMEVKGVR